jgi:hypothetical protein
MARLKMKADADWAAWEREHPRKSVEVEEGVDQASHSLHRREGLEAIGDSNRIPTEGLDPIDGEGFWAVEAEGGERFSISRSWTGKKRSYTARPSAGELGGSPRRSNDQEEPNRDAIQASEARNGEIDPNDDSRRCDAGSDRWSRTRRESCPSPNANEEWERLKRLCGEETVSGLFGFPEEDQDGNLQLQSDVGEESLMSAVSGNNGVLVAMSNVTIYEATAS